jgi:histidyl-tRNA synthetase
MAAKYQAPRGTYDLLPEQAGVRARILGDAAALVEGAGFGQIDTPMFEDTDLFVRTVGEATDIVRKEMYTFTDQGGRSLTLRPEGTAPVCRAYLEHGMHKLPQPVKLWYTGPMFRYERAQAGRYRQHAQIGAEAIGSDDPALDAELIDVLAHLYARLRLPGVRLHLTSIGDAASRADYARELRDHLLGHEVFDAEQRARIEINPMRAFDWDDPEIVAVTDSAPKMVDRLSPADAEHFEEVRRLLDGAAIDYVLDPRLVRGLDYYTRTVFEFRCDALGAQSGIGGGGRYDGLVELLGGRPTPGIGFGLGLDRILLALREAGAEGPIDAPEPAPVAVVVGSEPDDTVTRLRIATELRAAGLAARAELGHRKLGKQLEAAARDGAHFAVILGDELAGGHVQLRDLEAGTQRAVGVADLARELERASKSHRHGLSEPPPA